MGEWAWSTFNRNPTIKSQIAKAIGCPVSDLSFERFKTELCKSPFGLASLDYCRIITTSAKHIGVENDDADFDVAVSAGPTTSVHRGAPGNFSTFETISYWRLKIHAGVKNLPALDAYKEVLAYWDKFFEKYPVIS